MKYMVMECHLSYAVVLDEEGRFLKVANRNYEVGQTVTEVVEMQLPHPVSSQKRGRKWLYPLAAMAACLVLMAASILHIGQMPYACVYMTINPEVRIDVNRSDMVVGLDGCNPDGSHLIEGYDFRKKDLDRVMDELVARAIDLGYLHEGGQITLVLDADSNEWIVSHRDSLVTHLNDGLKETLSVTITVADAAIPEGPIVIPVTPEPSHYDESDYGHAGTPVPPPAASSPVDEAPADSSYSESSYGSSSYGESSYTDSSYGENFYGDGSYGGVLSDGGRTDYDHSVGEDDNSSDYGGTDYAQSQTGSTASRSDYASSDYESDDEPDDSDTDYGSPYDAEDSASDYED